MPNPTGGQLFRVGFWFGAGFLAAGIAYRIVGAFIIGVTT